MAVSAVTKATSKPRVHKALNQPRNAKSVRESISKIALFPKAGQRAKRPARVGCLCICCAKANSKTQTCPSCSWLLLLGQRPEGALGPGPRSRKAPSTCGPPRAAGDSAGAAGVAHCASPPPATSNQSGRFAPGGPLGLSPCEAKSHKEGARSQVNSKGHAYTGVGKSRFTFVCGK